MKNYKILLINKLQTVVIDALIGSNSTSSLAKNIYLQKHFAKKK